MKNLDNYINEKLIVGKNIIHKNNKALFKTFDKAVVEGAAYWYKPLKRKCNKNINPENKCTNKKTYHGLLLDNIKMNAVSRYKGNSYNEQRK